MRFFNNASRPSWNGLLAATLLGTSTVQAMDLDLENEGRCCHIAVPIPTLVNLNTQIRLKR
jgi:mannan endo-1,6-alpha-mannosidase